MTSSESKATAALYAQHVGGVPELHAQIESYVLHLKIADVVQRIQSQTTAATDPAVLCGEFLRTYPGSEIICAAALKRLVACLTEQQQQQHERARRREDNSSVEDVELSQEETEGVDDESEDESERIALNQEETELVFETMSHHGQSKSVQVLGCQLMSVFCHRATVASSQGAQVMMNAVSNFPQDEQFQETIWRDLVGQVFSWHREDVNRFEDRRRRERTQRDLYLAFLAHLASHNAVPLGYAAMDSFTQNFKICYGVLDVMVRMVSLGRTGREWVLSFVRENPNIHALFQRVDVTLAAIPVRCMSTFIRDLLMMDVEP